MQIYWTKINKIIEETPVVKTYLLDCPEGYTWQEGSHMHLGLKGFNAGDRPKPQSGSPYVNLHFIERKCNRFYRTSRTGKPTSSDVG